MLAALSQCLVCTTEYRDEIETLVKKGYSKPTVAGLYADLLGVEKESLYRSIRVHLKKKHPPALDKLNISPNVIAKARENYKSTKIEVPVKITEDEEKLPMTKELYAQRLLELGFDPKLMNVDSLKHKDIIAAQKLLLEEKKLNIADSALKMSMMKFMAGIADESDLQEALEGEVVGESSIPAVTEGN